MGILQYNDVHTGLLAQRDGKLGDFILQTGFVQRTVFDDFFSGLCYNIVNQQLSMKACDTLWGKLTQAVGTISPEACTDAERLRACGLSGSKAGCIAACAEKFISGELSSEMISQMTDDEVRKALTSIKGIGEWTAEMTLIFCLGRMDVLSLSDYGIRKGLSLLHGIDMNDRASMKKYRQIYSPYGTVASIYLWEAARVAAEKKEK